MYYSSGLEYIVGNSYLNSPYPHVNYLSNTVGDNYSFSPALPIIFEPEYKGKTHFSSYINKQEYANMYTPNHSFTPEIFLNPSRPSSRFVDDNNEARSIAGEIFELMMKNKLDGNISINVLPLDDFKAMHSFFGPWSSGILGFSINGAKKEIFVKENQLDELMIVIGHEIGHVLTEALPNKHDEEAKAFAFSIEWAETIKKHNIANLGLSIKDEIDFLPARNGLHDVAFGFVDFIVKKGRKAIKLHDDLVKGYISVFDRVY